MASVASRLIEEVTEHVQSDSLEDARVICADGSYFPNTLRISITVQSNKSTNFFNYNIVIKYKLLHVSDRIDPTAGSTQQAQNT